MSNTRVSFLVAVAGMAVALPGAPNAQADTAKRITITEAVDLAGKQNPELAIAAKSIEAAERKLKSTKGLRLPSVNLKSNLFFWNKAIEFEFPAFNYVIPPEAWPPTYPSEPPPIVPEPVPTEPITVKGRVTSSTSLTVAQPITTLLPFNALVDADRAGLEASRQEHKTAELDVELGVTLTYLGVLQARAATKIADASVAQVQAQLERAKILEAGAVLQKVDVMRLEAALANTQQQAMRASAATVTTERQLVHLLGMPAGSHVEVVDELPETPAAPPLTEDQAMHAALGDRSELRTAELRTEQANAGKRFNWWKMWPNVIAIANVQHDEGGGVFAEKNSWFLGLTLEWKLWDFGNTWYAAEEAKSHVDQARMAAIRLNDTLSLTARNRALEAKTAYDAIAVAKTGLDAAEEAFRIQSIRFAEGAATTTDVLDAETEVTRARLVYTTTRYAYFMALANLARAVGDRPDSLLTSSK